MESREGAGGHSRSSAVGSGQPLSAGSLGAGAFQTGNQRCSLAKDIRAASPRQQFISSDTEQPIPAHSLEELPSAGTCAGVLGKGLGRLTTAADFCCHGSPVPPLTSSTPSLGTALHPKAHQHGRWPRPGQTPRGLDEGSRGACDPGPGHRTRGTP